MTRGESLAGYDSRDDKTFGAAKGQPAAPGARGWM